MKCPCCHSMEKYKNIGQERCKVGIYLDIAKG